ncbi:MAG: DUF58 domain-containing protein [Pyrinomonadaceae bacterium]
MREADGEEIRTPTTEDAGTPVASSPPPVIAPAVASRSPLRVWRNAILGTLLVAGGVVVAIVTSWARRTGDWELARLGAMASLLFVALITIFVVPPLLRSARAEVSRLDPPFQMTMGGLIFIGIFLSVAFAAYNTGNNLLFLIFSVLASTLFVAWSAARATLRDLAVSARFPDHIFAGEPAPVLVSLQNTKRLLPSFSILIEARNQIFTEETPGGGAQRLKRRRGRPPQYVKRALAYFIYVPHCAKAEQRIEQLFPKRGHVLVTGFELSTRFPFGFFRLRRRLRARNVELVIYPKLEAASDELHLLPMNAGRLLSARRGAGHDLYSLRDYQPQDDMRHIDWKATARASRLIVREFTSEDERRARIVFDTRLPPGGNGDDETNRNFTARFERGVTVAAALVSHFIEEHAEVRLTLGEEAGHYGTGREHLYACLRRLALIVPHAPNTDADEQSDLWASIADNSAVADSSYVILLTTAAPGSIPSQVWRMSHVIYL